ncbi:MAG: pseudouridylate synthase [Desulfobacteraceae bacterium]|nr:pseudouridylate synthase [Desulfobacteraceae bacterium]
MPTRQLDIIFQDQHYVAVNKPAGVSVHRGADSRGQGYTLQWVRDMVGRRVYPLHRLDRPTSGVLLFALDADAARKTGDLIRSGGLAKTYLAVVRGYTDAEGLIDYPVKQVREGRYRTNHRRSAKRRSAVTEYKTLATIELPFAVDTYPTSRYSLVVLRPRTGRRHQLRQHLKHLSHPIIGDTRYGKSVHNRFFASRFDCNRLLLAATTLGFVHPFTHKAIKVSVEIGGSYRALLRRFGWEQVVE